MIEVVDRVPTYPGRVKLSPVAGQTDTYDMVRADDPLEVGTPINKALFDSINGDLSAISQNVASIISDHSRIGTIASLAPGTEFGLYENGIMIPFIKVTGDYNGSGQSAVMRKACYKVDTLTNGSEGNVYENCKTDVWLNGDYLALLEDRVREAILEQSIPCTIGGTSSSVKYITRKVFIASMTEYGITRSNFRELGTPMGYFSGSSERKIALYNGTPASHWTRTTATDVDNRNGYIGNSGFDATSVSFNTSHGIRPMFVLPYDFEITVSEPNTANVMATAEVI